MKKILETERLILREYAEEDFDALYEILSDKENMSHYPKPYDENGTKRWLNWSFDNYKKYDFGLWAIELKETGQLIGDCGITMQNIDGEALPAIGYHIHKSHWRKGYGKEAASAVRDWCFNNTEFDTVYSYMTHTNIPSYSTAASIGMKRIKEYSDESGVLHFVYALTRKEWKTKNGFSKQRVYDLLTGIPCGKVITYGQLAEIMGNKKWARTVGNALHDNPDGDKYPCYKVVSSNGKLSPAYAFGGIEAQKSRLEADGIKVENYKVNLKIYGI